MGSWCEFCQKDVEQSAKVHARVHQLTVELKGADGQIVVVERESDGFSCPYCPPTKVTVMSNADSLRKHVSRCHSIKEKSRVDNESPEMSPLAESPAASTSATRGAARFQIREEDDIEEGLLESSDHGFVLLFLFFISSSFLVHFSIVSSSFVLLLFFIFTLFLLFLLFYSFLCSFFLLFELCFNSNGHFFFPFHHQSQPALRFDADPIPQVLPPLREILTRTPIFGEQSFQFFQLIILEGLALLVCFSCSDSAEPLPLAFKVGEIFFGDRTQLLNHELLTQFELAVNKIYGFVACIHPRCGYELVGDIGNHLKGHKVQITKAELAEIVALKADPKEIPLNGEIPPVQGLLIQQGFCCLHCNDEVFCAIMKQGIRNHTSKVHRGETTSCQEAHFQHRTKGSKNFKVSFLSCFPLLFLLLFVSFFHFSCHFVQVILPTIEEPAHDDGVVDKRQFRALFAPTPPAATLPLNQHDIPSFFVETGFAEELPLFFTVAALEKLAKEETSDKEKGMTKVLKDWFEEVTKTIKNNNFTRCTLLINLLRIDSHSLNTLASLFGLDTEIWQMWSN